MTKNTEQARMLCKKAFFYNFDILELTFNEKGVYTVIPVVNDPIDIFNDIQLPSKESDILKYVFMALGLLILLVILMPILPYIVKFVVWLILLPFKLIGAIFKGIGKLFHKKE